jgi:hypothetical protein
MPSIEDFNDDPPTTMGDSIQSKCETHEGSHGQNYKQHLKDQHRPEPEVYA